MNIGIYISILAACLGTAKDVVSKKLAGNVSGIISAFASFAFALPFYLTALLILLVLGYEDFAFGESFLFLVIARAFTDALAEWMKMKAFETGEISVVSSFISLSPLFLIVNSPLITGDSLPTGGILAILLVVTGTLLLSWKGKKEGAIFTQRKAILLSLCSAFFFSLNICFDRLAVQVASPVLSGFAMTLVAGLFLLPGMLRSTGYQQVLEQNLKPFSIRGCFECTFMICKHSALQFLQAPYVACIMKVGLIFSIIAGRVTFKEEDTVRKLLSSSLIVGGIVLIVLEQAGTI